MSYTMQPPKAYFDRKQSLDGQQYEDVSQQVGLINYNEKEGPIVNVEREKRMKQSPQFNDIWAMVLFLIHFLAYIGLFIYVLKVTDMAVFKGGDTVLIKKEVIIGMVISSISAVIGSIGFVMLIRLIPGFLIQLSFIFLCLASIGAIAAGVYIKQYYICAAAGIVLLIDILCWFFWRNRIALTKQILKVVAKFTAKFPTTILVGILFLVLQLVYFATFVLFLFSIINKVSTCEEFGSGKADFQCLTKAPGHYWGFIVYALFSCFWTLQVLKDIVHLTVAGTFASDYFNNSNNLATFAALGRAMSTSFGSICFGSLLLSIIKFIKFIISIFTSSDNSLVAFIGCCINCFLSCIEGIISFFNSYSYTYCAIYGTSFIEGGKATMSLIKDRGLDAVINDSLVSNVLSLGGFLVSVISIGLTYLYVHFGTKSVENSDIALIIGIVVVAFLMSASVFIVFGEIIEASATAFFVCMAEEPQILLRNQPDVYRKIEEVYPEVCNPV